jgi:hypothetical protein
MHWVPDKQIIVETEASNYAIAAVLSIVSDDAELHPIAFHSRTFTLPKLNYDTHDKELLANFEVFKIWRHYLEGSGTPIDVVTDHKNLEYFSTTKLLTCRQARWSEYLSEFHLVIRFRPGRLGTKPDALTRRYDVYPKGGNSDYASVNPHNFRPVFTQEQLTSSLRATYFATPVLRAAITLDVEQLHTDIRNTLPLDLTSATLLAHPLTPRWETSADGYI